MMLYAGYRVNFQTGRPTLTREKMCTMKTCKIVHHITAENSGIPEDNPFRVLLNQAREVEPIRESDVPEDMEKVAELDS